MSEAIVSLFCAHCGVEFSVIPSRLRHGRGKHCSPACQYAARREAPKIASFLTMKCVGCGSEFSRREVWVKRKRGGGKYCTRECRDKHRSGPLVPNWFGAPREYRGTNWQKQKRAARERDGGTCQYCGGKGTDVHHKIPYRLFDGDWAAANNLRNLITLCKPCHRSADAEIQSKEPHVG